MARISVLAGATCCALVGATAAWAATGDLTRMSVKNDGGQSATGGFRGVVSGDGRYVAFVSAEDLTGTPTGGKLQLYVRDRTAGTTKLASVTAAGAVAADNVEAGDFFNPAIDISTDGRFVVFGSAATNLVDADTNAKEDVFRKDMATGELVRISVTSTGEQGAGDSGDPSVSGDGTRVAFRTAAANILPGVPTFGVALRDTAAGTTTLVSANSAGTQANDFSERPSISADGQTVAFEAGPLTTNLYANDSNATNDIIVKTLATGAAVPAAVKVGATTTEGADVLGGNVPDLSGNGRYVVFQTGGVLDATNDTNAQNDIYRRDLQTGTTTLVSARNGLPAAGNGSASTGAISADGERGAFAADSTNTNLIATDTNAAADVFARTLSSQATVRLSERADGSAVTQGSETSGISGNGGLGVFTSQGAFAADDSNGATDDVYAKELQPTDTTAPTVTATVNYGMAPFTVTGTVGADPSGIAVVRVDGVRVPVAADGTFAGSSVLQNGVATVTALDGAGNVGTAVTELPGIIVCCTPPRPPVAHPKLSRVQVESRTIRATVMTPARATVRIYIQRAIRVKGKLRWLRSGKIRTLTIKAGTTKIRLPRPARRGQYRVRLSIKVGKTKAITLTRMFKVNRSTARNRR